MPEIMDGKNIADFIDPDILEKLDALEREEEKLEADGFYDSESDMVRFSVRLSRLALTVIAPQFDSEDEREAAAMKESREKKLLSQATKKGMKNRAALPRTAGLRTLSELTTEMTRAGLDPSRIQERAEMLAKVAGAKRKRQREEEEAEMEVDEDAEGSGDDDGEGMEIDGDEAPRLKRARANSGAVVAKGARHPRSNRQLAGMRDEAVSATSFASASVDAQWTGASAASVKSGQAAEPRPAGAQHARARRRGRPRDQGQNGASFPFRAARSYAVRWR